MNTKLVYLDYNSTTPVDQRVINMMQEYFNLYYGNPSSSYAFGDKAKLAMKTSKLNISSLLGGEFDDFFFTSGATESINLALKGLALSPNNQKKHIITSKTEHKAVLQTCNYLENIGFEIDYIAGIDFKNLSTELSRGVLSNADVYYLHGDHLGTATFVTNSTPRPTQFFLNLPFGETMAEQMIGAYDNPYKFNAKELDAETGLYYYGARYYNPSLSIWYGVDPLADATPSWSPYVYTMNNPIRYIDPTGMIPEDSKSPTDWVYNWKTNSIYWNNNATSQATAGENETYLGKSGTYTAFDNSTTLLNSNGRPTNNSLLGGLIGAPNLDPLIQAGEDGPRMSLMAFGNPDAPTISSPSPFRGKSQFDIVMVDTNPVMPVIASAVCPPCGYVAGIAQTTNDFSEGNYVSGTIGAVTLGASSRFGSKFVHGEYEVMTSGLPKNGKFQYGIRNAETNNQFRFERHKLQTAGGGEKAIHFNYGTEGSKHFFPVNASKYRPYVRQ